MKITLRKTADKLTVYIPKKDMEQAVVQFDREGVFGGTLTLANGWKLYLEPMDEEPSLPKTFEARKLGSDED
jgi:nitrogen fixation protein NifT